MSRIIYTYSSGRRLLGERPNILVRIATGVISALVLIASAFLGLFIFLAVLGILAVTGIVLAVRLWLFKRKVEAALNHEAPQSPRTPDYIDVEYQERDER